MPEVPRVANPAEDHDRLRRFTEIVSIILNSLLAQGYILRTDSTTFKLPGATGGTVTSLTAGPGIIATPDPITTTGSIEVDFDLVVPTSRTLTAGVGLDGGGDLSNDVTFDLANTAVTPGSFTNLNATINAQGQITSAANGSSGTTSPLTTKGDIYTFSTVDDRLPVGPNGYNLIPNSAQSTGLEWVAPGGGGGGGGIGGADPISSIYPGFTVAGSDDEFDDGSFSGWTAVNSGSHLPTLTETNNVLSISHPGSDANGEQHAWMKQPTIAVGSYVEAGFRSFGITQNFRQGGVMFANGSTYGAGAQAFFFESPTDRVMALFAYTNYNTQGAGGTANYEYAAARCDLFLRLKYSAANTFEGYVSPDGISWVLVLTRTITLTPTWAGFSVSTAGGTAPYIWSYRYVKFG